MHYEYSDGNVSCGHRHRTEYAARTCVGHLQLIRQWWREDGQGLAYREYREASIARAEVIEYDDD